MLGVVVFFCHVLILFFDSLLLGIIVLCCRTLLLFFDSSLLYIVITLPRYFLWPAIVFWLLLLWITIYFFIFVLSHPCFYVGQGGKHEKLSFKPKYFKVEFKFIFFVWIIFPQYLYVCCEDVCVWIFFVAYVLYVNSFRFIVCM